MKKKDILSPLLLLLLLHVSCFSQGQIMDRAVLLEINVGGSYNHFPVTNQNQEINRLNFSPGVGKAIKENLVVGLAVGTSFFNHNEVEEKLLDDALPYITWQNRGHSLAIIPFIRRYFWINPKLALYGEARAGYALYSSQWKQAIDRDGYVSGQNGFSRGHSFITSLRPGVSYFISPTMALGASFSAFDYILSYNKEKSTSIYRLTANDPAQEIYIDQRYYAQNIATGASLSNLNLSFTFFINR